MFNNPYLDPNTVTQMLSTQLAAALSSFTAPEFLQTKKELISSLNLNIDTSELDAVIAEMSSIPMHPYERLRFEYFPKDYKFKTIDDVKEPEKAPLMEIISIANQQSADLNQLMTHNLTCVPEHRIDRCFSFLSGDEVMYDIEKQTNYLEWFEMCRQIKPEDVTEQNSASIAKRIMAEFIRVMN